METENFDLIKNDIMSNRVIKTSMINYTKRKVKNVSFNLKLNMDKNYVVFKKRKVGKIQIVLFNI